MLDLLRRERWNPGPSARVNWEYPLAEGLVGLWVCDGAGFVNLVNHSDALVRQATSGQVFHRSVFGPAMGDDAGSTVAAVFHVPSPSATLKPTTNVTLVWAGFWAPLMAANNKRLFSMEFDNADSSPFVAYGMYRSADTTVTVAADGGGSFASVAQSASIGAGSHVFGLSHNGTTLQGWVDGGIGQSVSDSGNLSYGATARLVIGNPGTASAGGGVTGMAIGAIWNRVLSAAEHTALYADPACMLEAPWAWAAPVIAAGGAEKAMIHHLRQMGA